MQDGPRIGYCSHCGQRMLMRHGALLSPKLADIFDMIARRPDGVLPEVLAWVFYPDKSNRAATAALRTNIWFLNSRLAATDVRVSAERFGPYRVVRIKQSARAAA
jgi:hypothetical protein